MGLHNGESDFSNRRRLAFGEIVGRNLRNLPVGCGYPRVAVVGGDLFGYVTLYDILDVNMHINMSCKRREAMTPTATATRDGEISGKHGNTLIRTLRRVYGQSFAAGYPETEELSEVAPVV